MLHRHVAIAVLIAPGLFTPVAAQTKDDVNLSSACFDSLPYDTAHPCVAFIAWKSKGTLGALFTKVATIVTEDSLTATLRDSSDNGVAVIVDSQAPHGECAKPATGPDWISPSVAIHFDATRLSKKENRYVILVRGSAVAVQGNTDGSMVLALCYLARYSKAIEEVDSRSSGH